MDKSDINDWVFCSLSHQPRGPVQTIEEGVERVISILARELICAHDVDDLNAIYKRIDSLERAWAFQHAASARGKIDLPVEMTRGSQVALTKIIRRVEMICEKKKKVTSKDLITLYHLGRFSDQELSIQKVFEKVVSKTKVAVEDLLNDLPFCVSEEKFNEDKKGLQLQDIETEATLEKKKRYEEAKRKQMMIQDKRKELKSLRQAQMDNYPLYFDTLLDLGDVHLFEHMIKMRDLATREMRRDFVKKMRFSDLSPVVLEIKEAIVQHVRNGIPRGLKGVVFLLGGSGSGKSTTLCFLRGDQLVINGDFGYSSKTDKVGTVGHGLTTSQTLLPNVEIINGLAVVDFPGFDDSNEKIVSIGMECALKALIKMYRPKIVVIESITNIEGRFAALGRLANRLNRLLKKKSQCFLGVTKYSLNPSFRKIRSIEEEQTRPEQVLKGELEALTRISIDASSLPQIQSLIQEKERKLAELQATWKEKSLEDTPEKKDCKRAIESIETEMLKQTGFRRILRFSDLENQDTLLEYLKLLSQPSEEETGLNPLLELDSEDKALLDEQAEHLMQELNEKEYKDADFKDPDQLKRCVLGASLIQTLTKDQPAIGALLHLPEVPPSLVREYDKKIVKGIISKFMEEVIQGLNVAIIQKMLTHYRSVIGETLFDETSRNIVQLRQFVLGLLGRQITDETKAEEEWEAVQKDYVSFETQTEQDLTLPKWARVIMKITLIPYGIYYLWKSFQTRSVVESKIKEDIRKYSLSIVEIKTTLEKLKEVERMVERRSLIDEAFQTEPLSVGSIALLETSVRARIEKVRQLYGEKEWDVLVGQAFDQLFSRDFFLLDEKDSDKKMAEFIIPIIAALFDSDIEWQVLSSEEETVSIYSWESLAPMSVIRETKRHLPKKSSAALILSRTNSSESLSLEGVRSVDFVLQAWNLNLLSPILEVIEVKTPLTLALLGAVLLKKWK